ncbi:MAG: AEC family transporter [Fusobacteriaceae bacterium]|jgi:predicted permease|nr:AEC family transporter [Fusobacteriaceae bacterium]
MEEILIKSLGFIFIIFLGYTLKKIKFFDMTEYKTLVKIVMNITLPSVIISGFVNFKKDNSLFLIILISLGLNIIYMLIGIFLSRNKSRDKKILYIINFPGYNIGNFSLPFIQSFLGDIGIVAACMFDIGNALIVTGASYAVASAILNNKNKGELKEIIKKIATSAPLITYVIMLTMVFTKIPIPKMIETLAGTIGRSNSFLSMFLMGMMLEIKFKREYFENAGIIIIIRFIIACIASMFLYKYLPLTLEARKVVAILIFSPLSSLAPIYTEKAGGNKEISTFMGTFSIFLSLVVIIILINVLIR